MNRRSLSIRKSGLAPGGLGGSREPGVDGTCSLAALPHGQDDCRSAQHDVASCEDSRDRRLHGVFVGDDAPVAVYLQTWEGGGDERVWVVADRHDDDVRRDIVGLAGNRQWPLAARCVRFPELHLLHGQAGDPSLRVAEDLHGVLEEMELDPLLDLSLIHISEPTRLGMISYAVFCLKKKKK